MRKESRAFFSKPIIYFLFLNPEIARHKDCICKDGFEGSHCEYLAGTTPTLSAAKSESSSEGSYSTSQPLISDNTLFSLLAVLTVCICVLVLAFYIRAKRREKNARREAIELAEATEDLAMVQDSEHGIDSDTEII